MVCFGAVLFDDQLEKSFYGKTRPISDRFVSEALAISGFTREQHLNFDDPKAHLLVKRAVGCEVIRFGQTEAATR